MVHVPLVLYAALAFHGPLTGRCVPQHNLALIPNYCLQSQDVSLVQKGTKHVGVCAIIFLRCVLHDKSIRTRSLDSAKTSCYEHPDAVFVRNLATLGNLLACLLDISIPRPIRRHTGPSIRTQPVESVATRVSFLVEHSTVDMFVQFRIIQNILTRPMRGHSRTQLSSHERSDDCSLNVPRIEKSLLLLP